MAVKIKKEMEKYVAEGLRDILIWNDNSELIYFLVALMEGKAIIRREFPELESSIELEFKNVNGIPSIKRYDVIGNEFLPPTLENVVVHLQGDVETHINNFVQDLINIEQALFTTINQAMSQGYDLSFLRSEGLTYRYFTNPGAPNDDIGPLRVTAMMITDEDGDDILIFKYSTDNAINISLKSDIERTSQL
jgi:hypothetical protein|nr:MAG TPA: hypothetical protein [Caudoviricetes sp.]